jgi:putative inorganic carbon (HCO3(-)) transporter
MGYLRRVSFCLAFGSAVSILFSIALSQILLGLSLAAVLISGEPVRFPTVRRPLAALILITVLAVLASGDPAAGAPQIRKFFVFAILLVICTTFKTIRHVRMLLVTWTGIASLSAVIGVAQFLRRSHEENTYAFVVDGRITGFAGHWMTFGGEEMIVLLMLASFVLFSGRRLVKVVGWPVLCGLLAVVALGMTRCIFLLGVPAGLSYLFWQRRRVLVVFAFGALAVGLALAPQVIRERARSALKPEGDLDSNSHRAVCRIVGWEMIRKHPWLGLGPEQIAKQFNKYVPATLPRPLPHGWYGHLHNVYLQYAAERGIFGLLSLLWLIGTVLLDFRLALRRPSALNKEAKAVLHGAVAVIIAILAEGLFEYNLGDSEVLTLFLSVIACGYVAIRQPDDTGLSVSRIHDERKPSCVGVA